MNELTEWLTVAAAILPTCRNPGAFSALIAENMGRLFRMELDVAFERACYQGAAALPAPVGAPSVRLPSLSPLLGTGYGLRPAEAAPKGLCPFGDKDPAF